VTTQEILSCVLRGKLAELRGFPYSKLQALPKSCQEAIPGVTRSGVQVWIEEQQDKSLKVTVQAFKSYFLGLGTSQIGGFRLSKDGSMTNLKPSELE